MTDNEFTRTARAWLDDGPDVMSDRALQAALDQIHMTRQRRTWVPTRRFTSTGNPIRLVAGAAAVVLAAVIGLTLLAGSGSLGGIGGPPPTASPPPTPVPTPTPHPLTTGDMAPLGAGTYVTADPFLARVTFTLPAGWSGQMGGPYLVDLGPTSGPSSVDLGIFDTVYADPCDIATGPLAPPAGPTVDDLATALAALPALAATRPTDVTIDGYHGKLVTLTAPSSSAGCTLSPDGTFRIWTFPLGATYDMNKGEQARIWILDVDGQRLVIFATELAGQAASSKAEVQAVIDSIRIAPAPSPTRSPSPKSFLKE